MSRAVDCKNPSCMVETVQSCQNFILFPPFTHIIDYGSGKICNNLPPPTLSTHTAPCLNVVQAFLPPLSNSWRVSLFCKGPSGGHFAFFKISFLGIRQVL